MNTPIICNYPDELLSNMNSESVLVLQSKHYDISDIQLEFDNSVFFTDTYIGPYGDRELVLRNISDMIIQGDQESYIINRYRYSNILTFIGCKNITLKNLMIGHFPEMGGCRGGVLVFENCENIRIENCTLFGCGTIGLNCSNCKDIYYQSGRITKCNYELLHLNDCENVIFESVEMVDNNTREITILHSNRILFNKCIIVRNGISEWSSPDMPLIHIGDSSGSIVMKSTIVDVDREKIVNDESRLVIQSSDEETEATVYWEQPKH